MRDVPPNDTSKTAMRLDYSSLAGVTIAFASIIGGLLLHGGNFADIRQGSAILVVLGGTLGAVLLTTPPDVLLLTLKKLPEIFWYRPEDPQHLIDEIARLAQKARREGITKLEDDIPNLADPFLRRAIELAVDGVPLQEYRETLNLDLAQLESRLETEPHVLESAGGYAPTMGILGAVLGLIQVMKHIENVDDVGKGIAVAFVATLYGVGSANLVFLPAAAKLRLRAKTRLRNQELIMEGVAAVLDGLNPTMIRKRLATFLSTTPPSDRHQAAVAAPPLRVPSSQV
ncbi:MAG: flagellar motor protein [Bryobacterales bacterium]|nr:flagellar motor protein [Bryobacterales bacterium]